MEGYSQSSVVELLDKLSVTKREHRLCNIYFVEPIYVVANNTMFFVFKIMYVCNMLLSTPNKTITM